MPTITRVEVVTHDGEGEVGAREQGKSLDPPLIMLTPLYPSRGPWDILNRTNVLRICENIPSLCKLVSKDIERLSFIPSSAAPGGESTLLVLRDPEIAASMLGEAEILAKWGILIKENDPPGYPLILITERAGQRPFAGPIPPSFLRGALGAPTTSQAPPALNHPRDAPDLGKITISGDSRRVALAQSQGSLTDWGWIGHTLNKASRPYS